MSARYINYDGIMRSAELCYNQYKDQPVRCSYGTNNDEKRSPLSHEGSTRVLVYNKTTRNKQKVIIGFQNPNIKV
jgi:hypothetical protein